MNVLVVGGGAIGCLFAQRASKYGCNISILTRQLMKQNSVTVIDHETQQRFESPCRLIQHSNLLKSFDSNEKPFDILLIAVKNKDTLTVGKQLLDGLHSGHVTKDSVIVSLQNGMGNIEILREQIGENIVIPGFTYQGARVISPLVVEHLGSGDTFIGTSPNGASSKFQENLLKFAELMKPEGVIISENIVDRMWTKLLLNTCCNPIAGILGCKNGRINDPELKPLVNLVIEEFDMVAKLEGVKLQTNGLSSAQFVHNAICMCEENLCSMAVDMKNGNLTEIDVINGYLVSIARKHGVKVPCLETFYHLVKLLEKRS